MVNLRQLYFSPCLMQHTFAAQIPLQKMISRRNIRVKVMQTIYALRTSSNPVLQKGDADRLLKKHFDLTLSLYTFQLWFLTEVALYAETDARQKAAKHIPSALDLAVPTKIASNELVNRILTSDFYVESATVYKPHLSKYGQEWVRKIYLLLADSTQYAVYNSELGREKKQEKEILE